MMILQRKRQLVSRKRKLLVSFSGGETSAFMTWWILRNWREQYTDIAVVFANTGQENEETLEFVRDCDEIFGFGTVWIEAEQFPGQRKSPSFRRVTFETANRDGRVFEEAIAKYGIPNSKFKDCTRNLKRRPIEAYARSLGWAQYATAIGIRVDEVDRMSSDTSRSIVYPFIKDFPVTKPMVNEFWRRQNFRLRLKGYQGNCKWCWKKSFRKHLTLISENPEIYDFPKRMEEKYDLHGPEFLHDPATRSSPLPANYRRRFFRENKSVADLFEMYANKRNTFVPADDDSEVFDPDLDLGGGCGESCEVFGDD